MKKFTSGLLAGMILMSSVTVFAAGGRTIEVFDNVRKIVVNNIEKPIEKDNKPFVYNGTTYVPLRFVADALDENVAWNGETGTIYIGGTQTINARHWSTDIMHSKYINSYGGMAIPRYSYDGTTFVKSNLGDKYTNYLTITTNTREGRYKEITFPLNGNYSGFNGVLGLTDEYTNGEYRGVFTVLLDGKEVYKKNMTTGDMPKDIFINTKGALSISFKLEGLDDSGSGNLEVGVFNGEFIK